MVEDPRLLGAAGISLSPVKSLASDALVVMSTG